MTDFFISYTGADKAWAEWIGWVLEKADYSVTLQAWDFLPGTNFVVEMHAATQKCERTVVVLSPAYLSSSFGAMEWAAALASKKQLLPVRIQEVEPAGLLAGITYVDLVGLDVGAARNTLLSGVKGGRAKPPAEPAYPAQPIPRLPIDVSSIPEEKIPEPGPLSPGSRMPFSVNPLFVGREDDLRTLARQLKAQETSAIGQVEIAGITGLGGIGKTQLAAEFVHRYGRYFKGGVFWMSFADPAAVPAEVAACGRSLDLDPSYESSPLEQQIRWVKEAWQRPVASLLVFDNCEDEQLLDLWRPRFGGARVLVTSRRPLWDRSLGVRAVPITTLPRAASVELLLRFRPDLPVADPALAEIAAELGDLPLALHLAGSFLERYIDAPSGQPASYLKALRRDGLLKHPSLQGKSAGISPTRHDMHVGRTFALSFERLDPEDATDALARELLVRAAYFAPGGPEGPDHTDNVMGLAVTPDGRAVSASLDTTLKIWDLGSGELLRTLTGHSDAVLALAVTPDGRRAVSGSADRTLRVWCLDSGRELLCLYGHSADVNVVALTPDGRRALSGSRDHTLLLWDLESGARLASCAGHEDRINAAAVTPDGRRAVSASRDRTLKVWDLENGQEKWTLTGHTGWVNAVEITPDNRRAVSISEDSSVRLWDLDSGRELAVLSGHEAMIYALALTPDGRRAVTGGADCRLKVWDLETRQELLTLSHPDGIYGVVEITASPDGSKAVSVSDDGSLAVWDLGMGDLVTAFRADSILSSCAVSADGATFLAGERSGRIHILELRMSRQPAPSDAISILSSARRSSGRWGSFRQWSRLVD